MIERPTKADLDRVLSTLTAVSVHDLKVRRNTIRGEAALKGALNGNRVIITIADAADQTHAEAMKRAASLLREFDERFDQKNSEIVLWARHWLDAVGNELLVEVHPNGFPHDHRSILAKYRTLFSDRVESTLRDFEIGLGSSPKEPKEMVGLKPSVHGFSIDLKEAWRRAVARFRIWRAADKGRR